MDELETKPGSIGELLPSAKILPMWKRGIFWMFLGVFTSCSSAIWLFANRHAYQPGIHPPAFYVAIAGFIVYVGGRVLQVVQKNRSKKK